MDILTGIALLLTQLLGLLGGHPNPGPPKLTWAYNQGEFTTFVIVDHYPSHPQSDFSPTIVLNSAFDHNIAPSGITYRVNIPGVSAAPDLLNDAPPDCQVDGLAAGGSCGFHLVYDGRAAQDKSGTLTVTAGGESLSVQVFVDNHE
jgi:hypothetical protein